MKNFDVVALGELLIDFTENGISEQGNLLFEANPGGAPCNLLAMLAKLGKKTAFIGKVGNDALGNMLKQRVTALGINTDTLLLDAQYPTTLAFIHNVKGGERGFSFYRKPGADMMLSSEDIDEKVISSAKIFHFGSLSMTHEPARAATIKALKTAKNAGVLISFDPNLREPLWDSLALAKKQIEKGLTYADILKISDNEIQWLTNEKDYELGAVKLKEQYPNLKIIFVTLGKQGSFALYKKQIVHSKAFTNENTIETTGAGDTFGGCALNFILQYGINELDAEKISHLLKFANAAACLITTKKGALSVMPTKEEISSLMGVTN